jgi:hypothetical protein
MPTTVLATALPRSLADDAPVHLTVFLTHKLVDGTVLSDFPAAVDWPTTLAGCTFSLTTSLDPAGAVPLRVVSVADAASWAAVLPPTTPVAGFPSPTPSSQQWRTLPASRMSDHAVDLHLAAITAAPARRPRLDGDPVAGGCWRRSPASTAGVRSAGSWRTPPAAAGGSSSAWLAGCRTP